MNEWGLPQSEYISIKPQVIKRKRTYETKERFNAKKYYQKNKQKIIEKAQQYYKENKEALKQKRKGYYKQYYEKNKQDLLKRRSLKKYSTQYYEKNKPVVSEKAKLYYQRNKEHIKQKCLQAYYDKKKISKSNVNGSNIEAICPV